MRYVVLIMLLVTVAGLGQVQRLYDVGSLRAPDLVIGSDLSGAAFQQQTAEPTAAPTIEPTGQPTVAPTEESTVAPTMEPTVEPTTQPTAEPTLAPTTAASGQTSGGSDLDNSTGGVVAVITGAAAVILVIIASFIGLRRRER